MDKRESNKRIKKIELTLNYFFYWNFGELFSQILMMTIIDRKNEFSSEIPVQNLFNLKSKFGEKPFILAGFVSV